MAQFLHPDGNVGQQFLVQPVAQIARGYIGALPAGEWRRVDGERHGDGGLVDLHQRQRPRILGAGYRLADGDAFHAGNSQQVARPADRLVHPLQSFERVQLGDARRVLGSVQLADRHRVAEIQRALKDAPDRQPSQIVAVIQVRHQHLQHAVRIARRRRDMLQDRVEQRLQIVRIVFHRSLRHARLRHRVEHRKIELVLGGVQIDEQIVDLVQHLRHARVRPVDLVDHHDGRQLGLQRLRQHVARLRQRPFAGVHQQHDPVHHLQRALYLAAEIAVAGRVHNVDLHAFVADASDLGQDGDAALAFQFVGIHHAFDVNFVLAKDAALVQHGVHQRGLAMIHVGDDGDVTNCSSSVVHWLRFKPA